MVNNGEGETLENNKQLPQRFLYLGAVVLLVVGFAIGTLFGSVVNVSAWLGDEEDPAFEEAKPQLEQQLLQAKEDELILAHLEELRENSEIETFPEALDAGDRSAVVATVNGEDITVAEYLREEDQQKQMMMMMQGLDADSEELEAAMEQMRPNILDNMVAGAALRQQAQSEVEVASDEVEEQYQEYVAQVGGEEVLSEQLESEGMTVEAFKQEISNQLHVMTYLERYVAANLDKEELEFTDAELRELFEQQQEQMDLQEMQM